MDFRQIFLGNNKTLKGNSDGRAQEVDFPELRFESKAITENYTIQATDTQKNLVCNSTDVIYLTGLSNLQDGYLLLITNNGSAIVSLDVNGQNEDIQPGTFVMVVMEGTTPHLFTTSAIAASSVEHFTGDGARTQFQLQQYASPQSMDVWVNHACMIPSVDYRLDISTHTLIFTTAPANNASIYCAYNTITPTYPFVPKGYINGFNKNYLPSAIEVEPGVAKDDSEATVLTLEQKTILYLQNNPINGFVGNTSPNELWGLYLCRDNGQTFLQANKTTPSVHFHRYLAPIIIDSTGGITKLSNIGNTYMLGQPVTLFNGDLAIQGNYTTIPRYLELLKGKNAKFFLRIRVNDGVSVMNTIEYRDFEWMETPRVIAHLTGQHLQNTDEVVDMEFTAIPPIDQNFLGYINKTSAVTGTHFNAQVFLLGYELI